MKEHFDNLILPLVPDIAKQLNYLLNADGALINHDLAKVCREITAATWLRGNAMNAIVKQTKGELAGAGRANTIVHRELKALLADALLKHQRPVAGKQQ